MNTNYGRPLALFWIIIHNNLNISYGNVYFWQLLIFLVWYAQGSDYQMGLTVKRTTDLEKMLGQFTNPATTAEEKKKKDKFLAKDKDKKGQKK